MVAFLFSATICLVVLYLFYICILSRHNSFLQNRIYLLGSLLLSFIIPIVEIPVWQSGGELPILLSTTRTLSEVVVYAEQASPFLNPYVTALLGVYLIGFLIMGINLTCRWVSIRQLLYDKDRRLKYHKGAWVIDTNGQLPTFSYMEYIFFDNSVQMDEADKNRILGHELAHSKQGHTYDLLLVEFLKVLFWFHPLIYMYSQRIEEVHGYLADDSATQDGDISTYSQLLAKMALRNFSIGFARHFSQIKTLKRIKMMQLPKKKYKAWRIVLVMPLVAFMVTVFSCERVTEMDQIVAVDTNSTIKVPTGDFNINVSAAPDLSAKDFMNFKNGTMEAKAGKYLIVGSNLDTKEKTSMATSFVERLRQNPNSFQITDIQEVEIIEERDYEINELGELPTSADLPNDIEVPVTPRAKMNSDGVYDAFALEVQPEPEGGLASFYSFVGTNIEYPQYASSQGVEGKVFVVFIIDTDGSIGNVEVIKGLSEDIDREAIRVIENAPNWKPGMQKGAAVKVRMRLPITFKL